MAAPALVPQSGDAAQHHDVVGVRGGIHLANLNVGPVAVRVCAARRRGLNHRCECRRRHGGSDGQASQKFFQDVDCSFSSDDYWECSVDTTGTFVSQGNYFWK